MKRYEVIIASEDEKIEVKITARNEEEALKRTLLFMSTEAQNVYKKLFG